MDMDAGTAVCVTAGEHRDSHETGRLNSKNSSTDDKPVKNIRRTFLSDAISMAALGVHSLENDNFSECFKPVSKLRLYNSGVLYIFSFITRYFILFPMRLALLGAGMLFTGLIFFYGLFIHNENVISMAFTFSFKLFTIVFNCRITHHGKKYRLRIPHVYVSNHTSFIDFLILSSHKFCHACISESHGGLFGFIFNTIISKNGSLAFRRNERKDREEVMVKVTEHVRRNRVPMLIFPEGTCVNNDFVVLFQKGVFELDATVCPVGIKYKKDLMDPYWNRRIQCFSVHLLYLMTRWRIEADVYWMEPMIKTEGEEATCFAHRIKNRIAEKIGLKNTLWNGMFKSSPVLKDRQLFRDAFHITYNKLRKSLTARDSTEDLKRGQSYLQNERIWNPKEEEVFFSGVSYTAFFNGCCREYLRLKQCLKENIEQKAPEQVPESPLGYI